MLPIWLLRCCDRVAGAVLGQDADAKELGDRAAAARYHLGRGRRAREDGRYEHGVTEARLAIAENASSPWAHSLLGQCLIRQRHPDLGEARRALERACALCPSNGYFVRLLLEVLDGQGDGAGRDDALARAWWHGAPVERWLPDGPSLPARADAQAFEEMSVPPSRPGRRHPGDSGAAGRP